ncbi:MAG: mandelate racemase/muconate lactonizing enzyme family protein [Rhodospirillales bacterium]
MSINISKVEARVLTISEKTKWTYVHVETDDGISGIGEATIFGREDELTVAAENFGGQLQGHPISAIGQLVADTEGLAIGERAVVSALEHASWDIKAKREEKSTFELLGTQQRNSIPIYANFNRRTVDRSLEGFAESARDAVRAGYQTIKIAPFDGLTPDMGNEGDSLFDAGIDRIAATRDAIGSEIDIMVDCHWRLSLERTETLLVKAQDLGLYWVECPLPEDPEDTRNLEALKPIKDEIGGRLAGAEKGTNADYFLKLMAAGVYDVIMPDVKYTGGLAPTLRIAELALDQGVDFSPHNPSGPVCHIASLHVAAVVPNLLILEHQFDESPLFNSIFPDSVPLIQNGHSPLPIGSGLGVNVPVSF